MVNAQQWLDENYPKEERKTVKVLPAGKKDLEGILDLTDFTNLEMLFADNNNLTAIKNIISPQLRMLDFTSNQISDLVFLSQIPNPKKLTNLSFYKNPFPPRDLSIFSPFINI